MYMDIEKWVMRSQQIHSKRQLEHFCIEFGKEFGLKNYLLCVFTPTHLQEAELFMVNNYPSEWLTRYFEHSYKHTDPVVMHCLNGITPILWQNTEVICQVKPECDINIMYEAQEFGLQDGITVPLRGMGGEFGLFSYSTDTVIGMDDQMQISSIMLGIVPFLYEAISRIQAKKSGVDIKLTQRELECMKWTAEGKTAWETAQILGVSERTVNFHVNNVIEKMGASNRQHAVAKVLLKGHLLPSI
ncbi:hypothetical protein CS022_21545 [Veronia nyctiphanis]|uniref:HTH luxR-type domain-containing protein n=1 Tax=Veronia nyctiphanis TaxID=1278244 RepID=A0A4Q0YKH7_9GAMM|nr:LuxR family transcriptional regulator [Veronia nyctiphanis]RXJ71247.1 hypothetical protein CS022_21545 [Veronia nyctiphanis]